jgi:hypothetical protein
MKRGRVSSPVGLKISRDGSSYEIPAPLMFGTVMLMANGAGAQNSVKPFQVNLHEFAIWGETERRASLPTT